MKKIIKKIFTAFLIFTMSSCNIEFETHIHSFSKYYDNGDGTHSRTCLYDIEHVETSNHTFNDGIVIENASDKKCGARKVTCIDCGFSKIVSIYPEGLHTFDKEIVDDLYLYKKTSDYSGLYYKSCECGAYGDINQIFEYNSISNEYSVVNYVKSTGSQFIDLNIDNSNNYFLKNSTYNGTFLPSGYTLLEYIEANGKQQIDTGICFDMENGKIECEFQSSVEKQNGMIIANSETNNHFWFYHYEEKNRIALYSRNSSGIECIGYTSIDLNRHTMTYENKTFYIDDDFLGSDTRNLSTTDTNLFIFSWNEDNKHNYNGKIYSCKIYGKNDSLIRNYIPCKRNIDNEIGLYDLVSKTFFKNTGTGSFIEGPSLMLNSYMQLEYIESTGLEYIDTNYYVDYSKGFKVEIEYVPSDVYGRYCMLSNFDSDNNLSLEVVQDKHARIWLNSGQEDLRIGETLFGKNKIVYSLDNNVLSLDYNGETSSKMIDVPNNSPSTSLYMFIDRAKRFDDFDETMKLYSYKIYEEDILVRNFIPSKNQDSNEVGLFDLVENKFYTNEGEGNFLAGPIISNTITNYEKINNKISKTIPDNYQEVSNVKVSNNNMLDTNIIVDSNSTIEIKFKLDQLDNFYLFGTENDFNVKIIDNKVKLLYQGNNYESPTTLEINKIYTIVIGKKLDFEDDLNCFYFTFEDFNIEENNLYLFNDKNCSFTNGLLTLFKVKIYTNNLLSSLFIPSYEIKSDDIGLYNVYTDEFNKFINKQVYGINENTSSYTLLNTKIDLPEGYKRIDSIHSNGSQYIDTLIKYDPTIEQSFKIEASFDDVSFDNQYFGYSLESGAYIGISSNRHLGLFEKNSTIKNDYVYGFEISFKNNIGTVVFNNKKQSYELTNDYSDETFTLFTTSSVKNDASTYFNGRIYSLRVYESDCLVNLFIPAINSNNEVGLYDVLNDTFFTSSTDSQFEYDSSVFKDFDNSNLNLFFEYNDNYYFNNKNKISSLDIYDSNNSLVRQLVSVIRNSDSTPGLYDVLNNVFYYPLNGNKLEYGEIVGHSFDNGIIIKNASKNESGLIEYTCKDCGLKRYEIIDKLSYEVSFINNTNCQFLVYNSFDISDYELSNIAYSRNINTCNYSKSNAVVIFAIYSNEKVSIELTNGKLKTYNNYYVIYDMNDDSTVTINNK